MHLLWSRFEFSFTSTIDTSIHFDIGTLLAMDAGPDYVSRRLSSLRILAETSTRRSLAFNHVGHVVHQESSYTPTT